MKTLDCHFLYCTFCAATYLLSVFKFFHFWMAHLSVMLLPLEMFNVNAVCCEIQGPMPLHYAPHQGLMTLVPTPQPGQQPIAGTPTQSGGPAGAAQHHMMMTQPAAQQHSLHTGVPLQMIMPSQPQPGIQAPPVGAHQYVQAHAIPGNLFHSSLLCGIISI